MLQLIHVHLSTFTHTPALSCKPQLFHHALVTSDSLQLPQSRPSDLSHTPQSLRRYLNYQRTLLTLPSHQLQLSSCTLLTPPSLQPARKDSHFFTFQSLFCLQNIGIATIKNICKRIFYRDCGPKTDLPLVEHS